MLIRALDLKDHLQIYVNQCQAKRNAQGKITDEAIQKHRQLTEDEWASISILCDALQPFNEATKLLQSNNKGGSYGFLWECLPVLEWLMLTLEELKNKHGIHNKIGLSANDA